VILQTLIATTRGGKPRIPRILLCLTVFYVYSAGTVVALDPHRRISQYAHTAWRSQDGVVRGFPMTQTTDGYLWLGTSEGLFRFDGVRFVRFAPKGLDIPSRGFTSLLGSRDGSLWIGTPTSLSRLKDGKLQNYSDPSRRISYAFILEDRTGIIWVTRYHIPPGEGPLCRVEGDKLHCFGEADGVPNVRYGLGLTEDPVRNLWFGGPVLSRWRPGSKGTTYMKYLETMKNAGDGVIDVAATRDGTIWATVDGIGPQMGVRYFSGGKWAPYIVPGFDGTKIRSHTLFVDKDNSLWVATENDGIYRLHHGIAEHYGTADGLSGDSVTLFYEDHEGDLWVLTDGGMDKFRDTPVVTYSAHVGLSASDVSAVLALLDGAVWIGNEGGVDIIAGEKFSHLSSLTHFQDVGSLFQDHSGAVWVGTRSGVVRYEAGHFEEIKSSQNPKLDGNMVNSITEDTKHNIWALTARHQLFLISNHIARQVLEVTSDARDTGYMAPDKDGGLWIAAANGTLTYYRDGIAQTITTLKDRYGHLLGVHDIAVSSNNTLLTSTNKGLFAWNGHDWSVLGVQNGLPCDEIFTAIEDNHSTLWLSTRCGYAALQRAELDRWREDNTGKLQVAVFDRLDGARPSTSAQATKPLSTKSPDGKLWFANQVTVQMIDPNQLYTNRVPPPVHIEKLVADHKDYELGNAIGLPALTRDVEIDYTALSVVVPQKVAFRYRLEERDQQWQEAGTRRQALYNDLAPGHYRFHVIACNNDGVWNEGGAFLDFAVLPAYYQTTWFRLSCLAVFLAALWTLYGFRLRQLQRQFDIGIEARVNERTRIARELHDTLLQSFHGLLLRFQAASNLLPARPDDAKNKLETAIDQASQAIAEGRDAVQDLRSSISVTTDLAAAIRTLGEELAEGAANRKSPIIDVAVEGKPQELNPIVRDEVYRISAEGLRNAFRHAQANKIEVEIRYDVHEFRVRIRDDGKGIDAQAVDDRVGHFGLAGMRERAQLMGANLEVWSNRDSGTEIQLSIPASVAYRSSRKLGSLWSSRRGTPLEL
jgi:signal transduction histidine kinase/ligand-binding sensor domain-containing protein